MTTEDSTENMPDYYTLASVIIRKCESIGRSMYPACSEFETREMMINQIAKILQAELDRCVAGAENNHTFCPHCKPCKNAELITNSEDVMREIACVLGVGGYNTDKFDPETFKQKIMDGIDLLVSGAEERQREKIITELSCYLNKFDLNEINKNIIFDIVRSTGGKGDEE